MPALTIADEVIIVTLAAAPDGWPVRRDGDPQCPERLPVAVAGAMLAMLAVSGRIAPEGATRRPRDQPVAVHSAAPIGDDASDELLRRIGAASSQRSVRWWLREVLRSRPHLPRIRRLHDRQRISYYDKPVPRLLGGGKQRMCFAVEGTEEYAVGLIRQVIASGNTRVDPQAQALLAMLAATDAHRSWLREYRRRDLDRRVLPLVKVDWIADAVRSTSDPNAPMQARG